MDYISFRGVRTDALGLYVAKGGMPSHRKAKQRNTEYDIPGRSGAVHVMDGYSPIDLKAVLIMVDGTAGMRQIINAWADGTGDLYTSDDTTKIWMASVLEEVQYSRTRYGSKLYDTATITFRCQPFMRQAAETAVEYTADGTIANAGNVVALPKIVITGNGNVTFSIAGQEITINGMETAHPVTIDCETGYIFTDEGACEMVGEIPSLPLGTSNITIGTATKIAITPHWGWM